MRTVADVTRDTEDLAGLKVSHDFDELEDGEARILTLKDSRILDNEGECRSFSCCGDRMLILGISRRG